MRYKGGCLCGAVRYIAEGSPINERICHCRICQKALGAAFNARLLFRDTDVQLTGPAARFHSSPALERGFCPGCGTTVFSARRSAGVIGLTAGSLDDPGQFRPDMHFWTSSRQPWLRLDDGLPQYPEGPPG
ncbi:GFA family protein [Muricoccus pecuniae]|uniref:CENP-V/GFA domain-containing protein n=1 Tax=Muricoccus pecuniae TaxID=693023 RepID=A0A840YME2_9PROT|nr:GFA family protein [Roseomonas pecuniae]MBB5695784.1 hypothetical protein [Roseomonas pecuniae]